MNDTLGDRIKNQYEDRTRYYVPRRTYTILRLDGCHFHTYTRGLQKPFDNALFEDIDAAILAMLPHLQGAVLAYTQSDEISVLLTDFAEPSTCAWFDGNLQKMCSVAASIITAEFNKRRLYREAQQHKDSYHDKPHLWDFQIDSHHLAYFDTRVFTIPDRTEVMNYFIWRNQDCARNSVSMVAQSHFSHKELHGKSTSDKHEMLHNMRGVNWATDYTDGQKNGRLITKDYFRAPNVNTLLKVLDAAREGEEFVERSRWVSNGAWKFAENKEKLLAMIPQYPV